MGPSLQLQGLVTKSVNRKKPGIGSWTSFEDGLEEYKENELRKEWWYYVREDNPYSTRNERRINKSLGTVIQPMKKEKPKQKKKPKNIPIPEEKKKKKKNKKTSPFPKKKKKKKKKKK